MQPYTHYYAAHGGYLHRIHYNMDGYLCYYISTKQETKVAVRVRLMWPRYPNGRKISVTIKDLFEHIKSHLSLLNVAPVVLLDWTEDFEELRGQYE